MAANHVLELVAEVPRQWEARVDVPRLTAAAEAAIRAEGLAVPVQIDLSFVDDAEIRELNARYRGIDVATDVLSFPLQEPTAAAGAFVVPPGGALHLGDIVISFPRAVAQAEEYGHSLDRELAYLLVHGVLHLLGYDHEEEAERSRMRQKEEAALAAVGLTR